MSRRPPHTPPWQRVTSPGLPWTTRPPTGDQLRVTREWLKRADWGPMQRRDFIACRWFEMRENGVEDIEAQLRRISADVAPRGGNPAEVLDALEFMHTHWKGATCDA